MKHREFKRVGAIFWKDHFVLQPSSDSLDSFEVELFSVNSNSRADRFMSTSVFRAFLLLVGVVLTSAGPLRCARLDLPPSAYPVVDQIYSGDLTGAIEGSHRLQQEHPEHPLGYLLEAETLWWEIWCTSAEFRYGMSYPRHRAKLAADQHYLDLAAKASSLAEAQIAVRDTAEMQFYAGMGDAQLARIYGLRGETRNGARAGVRARERLLRAVAIDPDLSDAYMGLGLYNYYADTLSGMARVLRFFMGIPGGSKQEGIQQLEHAIGEGVLTPPEARFYLAVNLHNYEQKYEQALQVARPLAEKYPANPLFQLICGDLYAKLGRRALAEQSYRAAGTLRMSDEECNAHIRALVQASLAAIGAEPAGAH
jgi:tetratricopeptide (TPR) repeat protein